MATIPQVKPEKQLTSKEAAAKLYEIIEGHFDELGISEAERDKRYAAVEKRLDAKDVEHAKS